MTEQIAYALEYELPHPGDNIVPRVPALNKLCECPAVQGALQSLLGDRFVFLPHRFPHNSDPLAANAATTSSGLLSNKKRAMCDKFQLLNRSPRWQRALFHSRAGIKTRMRAVGNTLAHAPCSERFLLSSCHPFAHGANAISCWVSPLRDTA